jgi:hypothetical protein
MAQAGRDISIDGVQSLPLLKAFSQEVLRFSPPVDALSRVATHDDIIPLSRPITLTDGEQVDHLAVPKGKRHRACVRDWSVQLRRGVVPGAFQV